MLVSRPLSVPTILVRLAVKFQKSPLTPFKVYCKQPDWWQTKVDQGDRTPLGKLDDHEKSDGVPRHRENTLFCRAVTSILSQRLLHKMTNARCFDSSYSRSLNVKTQYLASILSDKFDKYICRSISCTLGKWSLHSKWNVVSTFTEFTRPWRRTLTNGSDVKDAFPLTNGSDVKYVFPQCRVPPASLHAAIGSHLVFWSLRYGNRKLQVSGGVTLLDASPNIVRKSGENVRVHLRRRRQTVVMGRERRRAEGRHWRREAWERRKGVDRGRWLHVCGMDG